MDARSVNGPGQARAALWSKPAKAVVVVFAMIAAAYVIPGAKRFRLLSPKADDATPAAAASDSAAAPVGEAQLVDETEDRPELAIPENPEIPKGPADLPPLPPSVRTKAPPVPIQDPSGRALTSFFQALVRIERKEAGAKARILHYGDSLLAIDYVSGTLRRKLQERFGDAGHGYMPIANPWPGYFHNDVFRRASKEWPVSRVVGPFVGDHLYGLGGVSFTGRSRAAWSQFATSKKGKIGLSVSRFVVQYLEQPKGGEFEIIIDKEKDKKTLVRTEAEEKRLATHEVRVPDGPHHFEVSVAKGPVRMFGAWMERDVPGVVLDSVGIQGCRLRFLDQSDDAHWASALRSRSPNLVILEFGLNESADGLAYPMDRYRETSIAVLEQIRTALPNASCLIVAPNDVARKKGTELVTRRVVPLLVKEQKEVAAKVGCAFFNTYEAMGGFGSMAAWYRRGLGGPDLTHPTVVGADVIATWIFHALMDRYHDYRESLGASPAPPAPSGAPAPSP